MCFAGMTAQATNIYWEVQGIDLGSGGFVAGDFYYNAATLTYSGVEFQNTGASSQYANTSWSTIVSSDTSHLVLGDSITGQILSFFFHDPVNSVTATTVDITLGNPAAGLPNVGGSGAAVDSVIPEPTTVTMMLLGALVSLGATRLRRIRSLLQNR